MRIQGRVHAGSQRLYPRNPRGRLQFRDDAPQLLLRISASFSDSSSSLTEVISWFRLLKVVERPEAALFLCICTIALAYQIVNHYVEKRVRNFLRQRCQHSTRVPADFPRN